MYLLVIKRIDLDVPDRFGPDTRTIPQDMSKFNIHYDPPIYFESKEVLPEILERYFCDYQDKRFASFRDSSLLADTAYATNICLTASDSSKEGNEKEKYELEHFTEFADYSGQGEGYLDFNKIDFSDADHIYISADEYFDYYIDSEFFEDYFPTQFYGQIIKLSPEG